MCPQICFKMRNKIFFTWRNRCRFRNLLKGSYNFGTYCIFEIDIETVNNQRNRIYENVDARLKRMMLIQCREEHLTRSMNILNT